jgi:L-alanine-DL-glutamate epimerase-like enolase superfamily enzyme
LRDRQDWLTAEPGKGDGLMAARSQGNLCDRCASIGPIEITGAELFRVSIPLREPFRISSGEISRKAVLLVRISAGDAYGWESSAMSGSFYSNEGTLASPSGPGWGFEVDPVKLDRWCVRRSSM